jgi:enterochelin esterase family protein
VLDNLIHRGEMPVTVGVFVAPGEPGRRNIEYDAFGDASATFLLTEILPDVRSRYAITDDPDHVVAVARP